MRYIGSQRQKLDRLDCKKDVAEILKIAVRANMAKPDPKVEKLIREIKEGYDEI